MPGATPKKKEKNPELLTGLIIYADAAETVLQLLQLYGQDDTTGSVTTVARR